MSRHTGQPLPPEFAIALEELAASYLRQTDPIKQSGFFGGPDRWRAEREPILQAVETDGEFLDIGCANGYLLESLVRWARARGIALTPHGLEQSSALADLARERLGELATIHVGNASMWAPPRRFDFVYTMNDVVPPPMLTAYLQRLAQEFLSIDGRLILGAYGSRSRNEKPIDVEQALNEAGLAVEGVAWGGDPSITMFAWTRRRL